MQNNGIKKEKTTIFYFVENVVFFVENIDLSPAKRINASKYAEHIQTTNTHNTINDTA